MKAFSSKLYHFSLQALTGLFAAFFALLFAGAFLATCYATDMSSQLVLARWDNLLVNAVGSVVFLAVFALVLRFLVHSKKALTVLKWLVIAEVFVLGALLIVFGKTVPAADAMSVYSIAESLAGGDTSVIHPTASYLSYYPQQVGLVAFFEVLIRMIGLLPGDLPAYHFIKIVYVVLTAAIVLLQYHTLKLWGVSNRTLTVYLLLAGLNLPLIMYSSFVYGETPSFAALSAGILFLTLFYKKLSGASSLLTSCLYGLLSCAFFVLGTALRKNSLIVIIAVVLAALFQWLKDKKALLLVFAVLTALLCVNVLPVIERGYEHRADSELKTGVPAMSYFAMGMQESSRGNGWYNGFNFYTYQDSGMDTEQTVELSRAAIRERLTYFREHPDYAGRFYLFKTLSQWADGTYACRQATLATFGGRTAFFDSVYEGRLSLFVIEWCNIYQNVLYLGVLLFVLCIRKVRKNLPLIAYLGLIAVFGGFLFHTVWEANSRYIFCYGLLLLPYAALGISQLLKSLTDRK